MITILKGLKTTYPGHPVHADEGKNQNEYESNNSYKSNIIGVTIDYSQAECPQKILKTHTPILILSREFATSIMLAGLTCRDSQKPTMYMATAIELATVNMSPMAPPNWGPRDLEIM